MMIKLMMAIDSYNKWWLNWRLQWIGHGDQIDDCNELAMMMMIAMDDQWWLNIDDVNE